MPSITSRVALFATCLVSLSLALTALPAFGHDPNKGESDFLLQGHGGLRIYRGTDLEENFRALEPEKEEIVKEEDAPKAAAPSASDAAASAKPTKRGIQINRAGQTSRGRIKTQKAKHRAGGSKRKKNQKTHGISQYQK